ncbi:unnamed protein product [Kuraishia capsulata CBS 1993]|uniref:Mevalonate kinase n=1 Tax=Kuraishia capsulata CBS 1993 TaxID=1382522 RepID=W6MNQ9_9ASCO|nr:uncharacterized protein KUCA_T00003893001 [Kuraishia capsulata CBS 1993]CDK27913.1 unnamed protein product [Kuraishia capsulata CBS 1993]
MASPAVPFVTSAPGKVILFGEHSAVYNKPAIAAALSLRTYLLVTKNPDPSLISLEFKDIGFSHSWKKADLPWHLKQDANHKPTPSEELDPELVDGVSKHLTGLKDPLQYSAAYAFLFLYMSMCSKGLEGLVFTVRSTLPIGAGLGSSASISVCLASAFAILGKHIQNPSLKESDITAEDSEDCKFIDAWSFMGEKCLHGNPSGIDNAVATHGGAVMFQRKESSVPSVRTSMRNFPSLKLLLTNTKVPRRTATLVGNVSSLVSDYPVTLGSILDAMESLTREAYNLMLRPFFDESAKSKLRELVRINHGLLVALGVSHPSLEKIKQFSDELAVGETKLTGAGGGGCAITLLKDSVEHSKIAKLVEMFEEANFECYETMLGGKGVGMLVANDAAIKELLTVENFIQFKNRKEIEDTIGTSTLEWRYW